MKVCNFTSAMKYASTLTDFELISAFAYCNKVLKHENAFFANEFLTVCSFFFDSDKIHATEILNEMMIMYKKIYLNRHLN